MSIAKILGNFTEKGMTELGHAFGRASAKATGKAATGTAEAATKSQSIGSKFGDFIMAHPKGSLAAGAIGLTTVAPDVVGNVVGNVGQAVGTAGGAVLDSAGQATSVAAAKLTNGAGSLASGALSFLGKNSSWLLPVAGIAGAGLLLGGGSGFGKVALLGGAAFLGFNALKSMSQPSNNTIAESMEKSAEAQSANDVFSTKTTNALFGTNQKREMVDTSNLPSQSTQNSMQMAY